jgi:hypothetical protein
MSTVRLLFVSLALLNVVLVAWLGWARRRRRPANVLSRMGVIAKLAVFFLGLAIVLLANISLDAWSIEAWTVFDWIGGVCAAVVLYSAGVCLGALVEMGL